MPPKNFKTEADLPVRPEPDEMPVFTPPEMVALGPFVKPPLPGEEAVELPVEPELVEDPGDPPDAIPPPVYEPPEPLKPPRFYTEAEHFLAAEAIDAPVKPHLQLKEYPEFDIRISVDFEIVPVMT
eukprot:101629-Prorocentrum_minimum.AAC.1